MIENNSQIIRTTSISNPGMVLARSGEIREGRQQGGSGNRCSVAISKTAPCYWTALSRFAKQCSMERVSIDSLEVSPAKGRERKRGKQK